MPDRVVIWKSVHIGLIEAKDKKQISEAALMVRINWHQSRMEKNMYWSGGIQRKYSKNNRISVAQEVPWSTKRSRLGMVFGLGSRIRKGRSAICTLSDDSKTRTGTVCMLVSCFWGLWIYLLVLRPCTRSNICSSRRRDSIFSSTLCCLVSGHFRELHSIWQRIISSNRTWNFESWSCSLYGWFNRCLASTASLRYLYATSSPRRRKPTDNLCVQLDTYLRLPDIDSQGRKAKTPKADVSSSLIVHIFRKLQVGYHGHEYLHKLWALATERSDMQWAPRPPRLIPVNKWDQ